MYINEDGRYSCRFNWLVKWIVADVKAMSKWIAIGYVFVFMYTGINCLPKLELICSSITVESFKLSGSVS